MFIKSVSNGGGYRGDVNQAFRLGRRMAFDDQIDAYNKALQADTNTYNFNQAQVRDTAGNYALQVGMNNNARTDAYNFVDGSNKIADAVQGYQFANAKRDALAPYVEQVGQDQAKAVVFDTATKANNADFNNTQSVAKVENADTTSAAYGQGQQNKMTEAEQRANTLQAKADLTLWTDPNKATERVGKFESDYLNYMRSKDKAQGRSRTDDEILSEFRASPEYTNRLNDYIAHNRQEAVNNYTANNNGSITFNDQGQPYSKSARADKVVEPKLEVSHTAVPQTQIRSYDKAFNIPLGNGLYTDANRTMVYNKVRDKNGTLVMFPVKITGDKEQALSQYIGNNTVPTFNPNAAGNNF